MSDTVVVGGTLHSRLSRHEADASECLTAPAASSTATDIEAKNTVSGPCYSCSDSDQEEDYRVEEMDGGSESMSCVSKSTSTTTITSTEDDTWLQQTVLASGGLTLSSEQPLITKQAHVLESLQSTPGEDTNEPHVSLLQDKTVSALKVFDKPSWRDFGSGLSIHFKVT